MPRYRSKPHEVEAVQWFPDPNLGTFVGGRYENRTVGADEHGVEYLITEVGLHTMHGFVRIKPGDYIIMEDDGAHRSVCRKSTFQHRWEPVDGKEARDGGNR